MLCGVRTIVCNTNKSIYTRMRYGNLSDNLLDFMPALFEHQMSTGVLQEFRNDSMHAGKLQSIPTQTHAREN